MPIGNPFRHKPKKEPPTKERGVESLLQGELSEAIRKLQAFTRELREAEDMTEEFIHDLEAKTDGD